MPSNQTIPVTLTPIAAATDFNAANINQLLEFIASHLSGAIRADVSFFLEVLVDPTSFVTNLIFNSTQGVFKYWNQGLGRYVTITDFIVGDIKHSFVSDDQVASGWVVLNGRQITAVPGLSELQIANLQSLFPGGSLPTVVPVNGANLPAADSFSGISGVEIDPADGVIAGLPITDPPTGPEVEALRDATETLRDSTADLAESTIAIRNASDALLEALRTNTTPPMTAFIFVGLS